MTAKDALQQMSLEEMDRQGLFHPNTDLRAFAHGELGDPHIISSAQFATGTVLIGGGWQGKGDRVRRVTEIVPDNLIGNLRLARYAVPALAETRIVRSWLGFEAETDDALPIVGPLSGIPEAYVIGCVHSGYTSGPYFGRLLAQTILGHEPEMPLFDAGRLLASP